MQSNEKSSVAVITDTSNDAVRENLETRRFGSEVNFPLEMKDALGAFCRSDKITEQLQGHPVAIVALGIEERGDYSARIATLLDAWRNLNAEGAARPVLLLVTHNRKYAEAAIEEWGKNIPNWNEQCKAIVICEQLIQKGPDEFVPILNKSLVLEKEMHHLLSAPLSQSPPSPIVTHLEIKPSAATLAFDSGRAKT